MQSKSIDIMAQLALQYIDTDVSDIYNMLMRSVSDGDVTFLSSHYALMLTVAREARKAPRDIQEIILNSC
jgi:hypothetical protein